MSVHQNIFPSLTTLAYGHDEKDDLALSILLKSLGPTVKRFIFEASETNLAPKLDAKFDIILGRIAELCHGLVKLDFNFYDTRLVSAATLEKHLKSMRALETLSMTDVFYTQSLIHCLSSLPRLETLASSRHRWESVAPVSLILPERQGAGFLTLEKLDLSDRIDVVTSFLAAIGASSTLRVLELDITRSDENDLEPFPNNFRARHLETFEITIYFPLTAPVALGTNTVEAIQRCSSPNLHSLSIAYEFLLPIADARLIDALDNCPNLDRLVLSPNILNFGLNEYPNRLSLGCLAQILALCPLLRHIAGTFDLDPSKFCKEEPIIPHQKLARIDLGYSYFEAREPADWIPPTVAYLSSLTQGPCDITLRSNMCMDRRIGPGEATYRRADRLRSSREFNEQISAVNLSKRHQVRRIETN